MLATHSFLNNTCSQLRVLTWFAFEDGTLVLGVIDEQILSGRA